MIGIIGGSGLDDPKLLKNFEEKNVETPFGKPSSAYTIGKLNGTEVAILARHGKKHSINPTNVNYRANIWGLKELGAKAIIASSACGSLREEIKPGHLVFPDQFIDRTTKRHSTFYHEEKVCHIPMAEPFCPPIRRLLAETAKKLGIEFHTNKTVITIEGPKFSTKAESNMFRAWGADVINMSTVPECVLARETGIHYQVVCMATDFDCWKEREKAVTIDEVLNVMKRNADNVKRLFMEAIPKMDSMVLKCRCEEDIKTAII